MSMRSSETTRAASFRTSATTILNSGKKASFSRFVISRGKPVHRSVWAWSLIQAGARKVRSEEHTSELQSRLHLVCRLLLEKKKKKLTLLRLKTTVQLITNM